jgi:hypothetical protein
MNEKIAAHLFNPETKMWNQIYGAILYDQMNVFFYTDQSCSMGAFLGDAKSMDLKILKKGMLTFTFLATSPMDGRSTEIKTDRFTGKKVLSVLG